jgi:hypothetical protein
MSNEKSIEIELLPSQDESNNILKTKGYSLVTWLNTRPKNTMVFPVFCKSVSFKIKQVTPGW